MFASSARTPFGGSNAGFSAATNTQQSPFGNQMFGSGTTTTFGTSTPAFGQPPTPMFGAPQQPLFSSSTTGFGTANQNAFGSNALFGQQTQPQSNTSLFGSASNTAFGQQNKNTGFSFPSSQPGGLFGQTAPAQQSNIFQPSTSANIFGTSGFNAQTQTGTPVKFNPVTGTDSMQKGGSSQMINTKHHSITCMKEYETKSFEELRYEDYLVNRKGPQASAGAFGTTSTPFGAVASSAQSIFGQTDNKSAFGTANTFGQTPAFGLGNQPSTSQSIFGKSSISGFGSTITTANSFGFTNTPSTNIFGPSAANKPFGTQNTQSLFGTQQPQQATTGFGTGTGFFGQQATSQPSFFNKPVQSGFPSSTTGAFSFGPNPVSTPATNLFQTSKPSTGFNLPSTNAFGQQNTSFGGFGTFSKPAQSTFGATNQPTTAFGGLSNSLFGGNTNNKSTFGTGTNLFANSNIQAQNNTFALPSQQAPQINLSAPSQAEELRTMSNMTDPYGFSPHLDGLPSISPPDTHYTTNPKDLDNVLKAQDKNPTAIPATKKVKVTSPPPQNKWIEFDAAYEDEQDFSGINFKKNKSTKQLQLKRLSLKKPEPIVVYQDGFIVGAKDSSNACTFLPTAFKKPTIDIPLIEAPALDKASMTEEPKPIEKEPPLTTQETNTETSKTKDSNQNQAEIDTCGIICTRPEYYTIPPLNEISQYKNSDGSCMIKGFTIGRIAYGNVFFPDVMDVSNLNIDQLVHFRYKEISIYGENDEKPPVGEGLNRRAQVTLDRVYPRKESNKEELETDPEVLIADNFAEVLRLASNRANSSFVDYRPETGSWVFAVEHFSKYGLTDSEEKQCRDEINKKNSQNHKEYDGNIISAEQKKVLNDSMQNIQNHGLGGLSQDNLISYIPDHKELDFSVNVEHITMKQPNINSMMCSFYDESVCTVPTINIQKDTIQFVDLKSYKEPTVIPNQRKIPRPKLSKLINSSGYIPLAKSLVPVKGIMDAAVFKGRSFKVGWAKGFTIAKISTSERYNYTDFLSEDINMQIVLLDVSKPEISNQIIKDAFLDKFEYFMNIALRESQFQCQNGIPFVKIAHHGNILEELTGLFNKYAEEYKDDEKLNYYKNVFNLCEVFWGNYDLKDIYAVRRRFENWLENVCSVLMGSELAKYNMSHENCTNVIKKILILLSGHKINDATKLALEYNFPQLGMLISQLTANQNVRYCLQYQIHLWNDNMAMEHIDKDIIKLYLLICGVPFYNGVNVCEDFDWIRSLAIHFWYLLPSSKPLTHSIQMYDNAFSNECYAEKPSSINKSFKTWDIYYHLMKLYCNNQMNLDDVLSPATHTHNLTDFRLSWLLQQTLSSVGVGLLSEQAQVHINTVFSSQLEQLGLYKWSIFVLLFLPDVNLRKNLVMGVLDRNIVNEFIKDDGKDIENDLVIDLKIPAEWIHHVKALKCNQLGKYWASYRHLAFSQKWQECHEIIFQHLLSSLICNRDFDKLKYILEDISVGSDHIYRWKTNGGLIIEFINIWNYLHNNSNNLKTKDLKKLQSHVLSLASRLKYFPSSNSFELMIISEISKFCSTFYHIILGQLSYDNTSYIKQSAEFIQQLVMPFDYKFEEISKSICVYLRS